MRDAFHVELSAQRLFEAPTIVQLAATIEADIEAMRQAEADEDARTEELLKMVEQLSEEEVAALLSEAGRLVESDGQQCLRCPIASQACPKTGDACSSVFSTRREHQAGINGRGAQHPVRLRQRSCRLRLRRAGKPSSRVPRSGEVKASYKRFYDAVNSQLDASVFGPFSFFLNYGYLPNLSPQYSRIQLPDHFVNKNSVRLVLELIGDCDLKDRRILDVGCGRGGTVFVIKQFFEPRSVQGLDLSPNAIASCRASHRHDNVRFDEGDAENLPFDRELFDVVTNVESSHSYPNLGAFYTEVFRVLAPGGCFLYTDVIPNDVDRSSTLPC